MQYNPYHVANPPTLAVIDDSSLESWRVQARIWWSLTWRCLLYSALVSAVIGAILGGGATVLGFPMSSIQPYLNLSNNTVPLLCSLFALRATLPQIWKGYRLELVPNGL